MIHRHSIAVALLLVSLPFAKSQLPPGVIETTLTPHSSLRPSNSDSAAWTPLRILKRSVSGAPIDGALPAGGSLPDSYAETPASVACFYGLTTPVNGCPISGTTALPNGGSGTIAVIDAYHDPNAASDLATFSSYFGLPSATFNVVWGGASQPPVDPTGGWTLETSLDIEWAHAIAPQAPILLVEAESNSSSDLCNAVQVAKNNGARFVSMSFENNDGTTWDNCLAPTTVAMPPIMPVYISSAGDSTFGLFYPAQSPYTIAAGGTVFVRSGGSISESFWDDGNGTGGGGGISSSEARPSFQQPVQAVVGSQRGIPDISAIARNVAVYDSNYLSESGGAPGWITVEGTSISAPIVAARLSGIGAFSGGSSYALGNIYSDYANSSLYSAHFRDVSSGDSQCTIGYDICTGLGTILGTSFYVASATSSLGFSQFGKGNRGSTQTLSAILTNPSSSQGPVTVTGVTITADASSPGRPFSVTSNGCTSALQPGQSCTIAVTREPAGGADGQLTIYKATLIITTNTWNSPQTTRLSVSYQG